MCSVSELGSNGLRPTRLAQASTTLWPNYNASSIPPSEYNCPGPLQQGQSCGETHFLGRSFSAWSFLRVASALRSQSQPSCFTFSSGVIT